MGPPRHLRSLRFEPLDQRRLLATFAVVNTLDSGAGSLRQAIIDANSSPDGGAIEFLIPISDPNFVDVDFSLFGDFEPDVWRIQPLTELPALSNVNGGFTIDGHTQSAFGGDLNPFGPEIVLDGNGLVANGLHLTGNENSVSGLNIQRFGRSGIYIEGGDGNLIHGNYVGVDARGVAAAGNDRWGILLDTAAAGNLIGTNGDGFDDAMERNVISGNTSGGVGIMGQGTDGNTVAGNFIAQMSWEHSACRTRGAASRLAVARRATSSEITPTVPRGRRRET